MICESCGASCLDDDSGLCGMCQGRLDAREEELLEDDQDDPTCPHCGVRFNLDDWFMPLQCPVCAKEITQ